MNSKTWHDHSQCIRDATSDKFDEEAPRSVFGGGGVHGRNHAYPPMSGQRSTTVLAALTDKTSEFARFLFVGQEKDESRRTSWFRSFRVGRRGSISESTSSSSDSNYSEKDQDDGGMKSMGTLTGYFLSLSLEPMEIRNERVIMISEAFAIFGALFTSGMWIVWEWGSSKAYGSSSNEMVNRAFEAIMAVAITCNIMLALFGSTVWVLAIIQNGSSRDFVFDSRKMLGFCTNLLCINVKLVTCGLILGVYSHLCPYWPETIAVMCIAAVIFFCGLEYLDDLNLAVNPLEVYHMPFLVKAMYHPTLMFPSSREKLRQRAKLKAEAIKERAYHERKTLDPNFDKHNNGRKVTGIGNLLRSAAKSLGRADFDFSVVEEQLKDDWFDEVSQLRGRSVEFLSRYMPFRLAEQVHRCVALQVEEIKV